MKPDKRVDRDAACAALAGMLTIFRPPRGISHYRRARGWDRLDRGEGNGIAEVQKLIGSARAASGGVITAAGAATVESESGRAAAAQATAASDSGNACPDGAIVNLGSGRAWPVRRL